MSGKFLIKGGTVLSLDRSVGNAVGVDVLVEDGRIAEIGPNLRSRAAETIDASAAIVMPGFVDTHRHAWHSLFRNTGQGSAPVSADAIGPHHTPDHIYAATLAGLLAAIEAGITTLADWADVPSESAFLEAALQAHADAGVRSVFVAAEPRWEAAGAEGAVLSALSGLAPGNSVDLAYGSGDVGDGGSVGESWAAARTAGFRIHAHVGIEEPAGGVVARLGAEQQLGPDVTLVHCTNLDEADLEAIGASGAGVSLTPVHEMAAGYGLPPLQGLIDRKIRPGLGVGSEMEASGDLFAQMRAANSVQHATLFDLKLAGKGGVPNLLSTRDVIRFATIDGAAAIGLQEVTGSLAPGKRADLIVLRTDRPNIAPVNDPIGAVVWGMDTSNLDWVLVDGRVVMSGGVLDADVVRARQLAMQARDQIAERVGV